MMTRLGLSWPVLKIFRSFLKIGRMDETSFVVITITISTVIEELNLVMTASLIFYTSCDVSKLQLLLHRRRLSSRYLFLTSQVAKYSTASARPVEC